MKGVVEKTSMKLLFFNKAYKKGGKGICKKIIIIIERGDGYKRQKQNVSEWKYKW